MNKTEKSETIARMIWADILTRSGIGDMAEEIDPDIVQKILAVWAAEIRNILDQPDLCTCERCEAKREERS